MKRDISFALALAVWLVGCATTTFDSTWRAPDARPLTFRPGDKVIAMIISASEADRRASETALAQELKARGLEGVPAYTVIPSDAIEDKKRAKELVAQAGAVGVVTMRVISQEQRVKVEPGVAYAGPPYAGFWGPGYYGYGWGAMYRPGQVTTDTIARVETLVYDLRQDELVWAGTSKTINPDQTSDFIAELVTAVVEAMKDDQLIGARGA